MYNYGNIYSVPLWHRLTFDPEDEAALVLGVSLDVGDEGTHAPLVNSTVAKGRSLQLGQHVHYVLHWRHLLQRTLEGREGHG